MPAFLETPWIILLPIVWIGGWIVASVIYRRRVGKAVFPRLPADAVVAQRAASGRNLRSPLTSLGGASNCLNVAVTRSEFTVSPMFPFNLMFLPEIFGLELRVPLTSITSVDRATGLWGGESLVVHLGEQGAVELRLRNADSFERALRRA